jgi:hypothetical protein
MSFPNTNGFEVAEALAALRPDIRVLFLSGYTERGVLNKVIVKPGIHFLPRHSPKRRWAMKTQESLLEARVQF